MTKPNPDMESAYSYTSAGNTGRPVHPMCEAMTNNGGGVQRDWLKHFAEQTINQSSPAAGESPVISPEPAQVHRRSLPNAVMQTTPTNCFSACVATVLGIPITEVPIACDGAWWDWDAFQEWLAGRGLQAIEMTFENGGTLYPVRRAVRCILTGPSPRECTTGRHAIVGDYIGLDGFELLHDPHESQMWLDGEPTHAVFFVHLRSPAAAESPPISAEEAQVHGMTTPATPSAAVGASEPGAGDTEKLLPCPFCGESPDTHKWCGESLWNHESTDWHEVKCRKCDFEMQECEDIEALTARWNRRAAGDTVPRAEDRTKQQGLQIAELIDQLDVKDDTISKLSAENYRLTKLNHHLREAAVMAIVERVPSDSKPTNVHNPESEDTPPHNPVMGPVVGTATVKYHEPEPSTPAGHHVCFFCEPKQDQTPDNPRRTDFCWRCGHRSEGIRRDDRKPSTPAESPDDWVTLTDPEHVIRRNKDKCRLIPGGSWEKISYLTEDKIGIWPNFEFRCRRKDLPVKAPVTKQPSSIDINADKPRMRQVTLREYTYGSGNPVTVWTTHDAYGEFTGRTAVVEVPE